MLRGWGRTCALFWGWLSIAQRLWQVLLLPRLLAVAGIFGMLIAGTILLIGIAWSIFILRLFTDESIKVQFQRGRNHIT